jgi:hypothetical protein
MTTRTKELRGSGRLQGDNFDAQVNYMLILVSKDIPAGHFGNPSAVVRGATNDSITGRINVTAGPNPELGAIMVLTLSDGRKLKVIISDSNGGVTATGGLF